MVGVADVVITAEEDAGDVAGSGRTEQLLTEIRDLLRTGQSASGQAGNSGAGAGGFFGGASILARLGAGPLAGLGAAGIAGTYLSQYGLLGNTIEGTGAKIGTKIGQGIIGKYFGEDEEDLKDLNKDQLEQKKAQYKQGQDILQNLVDSKWLTDEQKAFLQFYIDFAEKQIAVIDETLKLEEEEREIQKQINAAKRARLEKLGTKYDSPYDSERQMTWAPGTDHIRDFQNLIAGGPRRSVERSMMERYLSSSPVLTEFEYLLR